LVGDRKGPCQPWGFMERNLFRYILVHSKSEQAVIFVVALLSQFFYFISLDIPKTIVNGSIEILGALPEDAFVRGVLGMPEADTPPQ